MGGNTEDRMQVRQQMMVSTVCAPELQYAAAKPTDDIPEKKKNTIIILETTQEQAVL